MFTTIEQVKAANAAAGQHWFEPDAMAFFRTRISERIYGGRYFVTSETPGNGAPRRYTVRSAEPDGTIATVGEFYALSRYTAHQEAQRLGWVEEARLLGVEHAEAAAGWSFDGNSDPAERARVLAMLRDGDPVADDFLPAQPNLSGEWADSLAPGELFELIVGREPASDADGDLVERLADGYEQGVGEAFAPACELALIAFCGERVVA